MDTKDKVLDALKVINKDVEILKDVSSGSDAYTYLIRKGDLYFYRKIALSVTGGVDKLKLQLDFLLKYGEQLDMAKVVNFEYNHDLCYYDMPVTEAHKNFFDFVKDNNTKTSWDILKNILNLVKNFHDNNKREVDFEHLQDYIFNKVFENGKIIMFQGGQYLQALQQYDKVVINGKEYHNIAYYLGDGGLFSSEQLIRLFERDICSVIHGDFTIDNIIYEEVNSNKAYLIDPNVSNLHETSYLDYAKLLQSLHGNYEYYRQISDVKIDGNKIEYNLGDTSNYRQLLQLYDDYLKNNFSSGQYRSIYAHELVHWLRLMPYKIRKDEKLAVLFYSQLLIEFDEYVAKFLGGK